MSKNDMVMFRMPDGTEVSNDPRFDLQEALAKSVNSRATTGSVGPTWDEQNAQVLAEKIASMNSGQAGVGEHSTPDDPTQDLHGVLGSPAQRMQKDDRLEAQMSGGSPANTSVEDDDPVDSNERVAEVRKRQEAHAELYQKMVDKLGEEGEGEGSDYGSWTGAQLKAEVARRNTDENRQEEHILSAKGMKKKSEIADLLRADDDRIANLSDNDLDEAEDDETDEDEVENGDEDGEDSEESESPSDNE